MTAIQQAAIAKMLTVYEQDITKYEAELAVASETAVILAWADLNLGVRLSDGKPVVCGYIHADKYNEAPKGVAFANGKGEYAEPLNYKAALSQCLEGMRAHVSELRDMIRT